MKMEQKLNTGFGTHFVQSLLLPFLVGLIIYGLWVSLFSSQFHFIRVLHVYVFAFLLLLLLLFFKICKELNLFFLKWRNLVRGYFTLGLLLEPVSHVPDIVGPVSIYCEICGLYMLWFIGNSCLKLKLLYFDCRLEWFMQWSFLIEVVEIWLTWQRSVLMLSQSLKMLDILPSIECWLAWWMWYFLMLLSLIRIRFVLYLFF